MNRQKEINKIMSDIENAKKKFKKEDYKINKMFNKIGGFKTKKNKL
jgi:hypothetical protein